MTTRNKGSSNKTAVGEIDADVQTHLLKQMIRIRRMEEKAYELYTQEKIRGFLHLYDGEEAVAAGVIETLRDEDGIVATYREHGHALVRGVSMKSIMAEMYGKAEGCSGGRGGSMHLYDKETNFYGGSAIVANGLPMAVGLALASKRLGESRVICCFFGEGAVDEGEFHESLNLASLWKLPVLFVCENNLYSMGMPFRRAEAETDLVKKANSYRIEGNTVDGMEVLDVYQAASDAVDVVRKGNIPYFLECQTYRYRAHSMFDPERYRDKQEVKEWKKRDPITLLAERLKEDQKLSQDQLAELEKQVANEVDEAVRFAEQGTDEPVDQLYRFVYSNIDTKS
ncbi:MAG: pyruvate dehydrogenase (acetyl-transferring) E1 component subunit alpha [Balneolaceae bacterium]|nr:pyruvate dehydrogenase (acetyl-transferring) E1 component subunit alpha [Balneolaceae bacterium]